MSYIFMDESGCLGFNLAKKATSKYFIVVFVCVPSKRPIEKIIKRIFSDMEKPERKRLGSSLHANKASPRIRMKLLHQLHRKSDTTIMIIRLNKQKVYTKFHNEKHALYNYITNILLDRIFNKKLVLPNDTVHLIASRRETNRFLNENFTSFLNKQITTNHQTKIEVSIKTPAEEKGLQIADFVSWSAFRKYEKEDNSYYKIIKNLIVEDEALFRT